MFTSSLYSSQYFQFKLQHLSVHQDLGWGKEGLGKEIGFYETQHVSPTECLSGNYQDISPSFFPKKNGS